MNATQLQSLASAYKLAKGVLREIEDGDAKHTTFLLATATGALETLCLQENKATVLTAAERSQFVAAGRRAA